MAILRERLEELIKQGATIYGVDDRWDISEVRELDAQQIYYSLSNDNYQYVFDDHSCIEFFEDELFETKEDAEEYAEFGNITRTERLELPSWEQVQDGFYYNGRVPIYEDDRNLCFISTSKDIVLKNYASLKNQNKFKKPLTRENYNEARRLCVKLFKGEE